MSLIDPRTPWIGCKNAPLIDVNDPNCMTLAFPRHHNSLRKSYMFDFAGCWRKQDAGDGKTAGVKWWGYDGLYIPTLDAMTNHLKQMVRMQFSCIIRAGIHPDTDMSGWHAKAWHPSAHPNPAPNGVLIDVARRSLVVDIDDLEMPSNLSYADIAALLDWVCGTWMPEPFRGVSCVAQLSSSAGLTGPRIVKLHLFYRGNVPVGCAEYFELLKSPEFSQLDGRIADGVQIIYTAAAELLDAHGEVMVDPFEGQRVVLWRGDHDEVDIEWALEKATERLAERKRSERKFAPMQQHSAAWHRFVRDYLEAWTAIIEDKMGERRAGTNYLGYRSPIFSLIMSALWHGEHRAEVLKERLRDAVRARAIELGDNTPERMRVLEEYLTDASLDEWIWNAKRLMTTNDTRTTT